MNPFPAETSTARFEELCPSAPPTLGIVAGWGDYPVVVARRLIARGHRVVCAGVAGHASKELAGICHDYRTIGLGQLGKFTRFFRRNDVSKAMMAGKIFKSWLFRRGALIRHRPDWLTIRYFWNQFVTGTENRNDDNMLLTVTRLFADQGIDFMPATDFAPDLLVRTGLVAGTEPSDAVFRDIAMGWHLASEMGRLDIGQSVAVKGRAVLAVEAIEGTDECIRRAGQLCTSRGFTVVKVAKPHQDMRFDVPTIGPGTIRTMHQSGGKTLAIEANRTIVLGMTEVCQLAQRFGITVYAFNGAEFAAPDFRINRSA